MRWLTEWLWNFLPDKCEMDGCRRMGVRGNENVVDGKLMCDYCHAVWMDQQKRRNKVRALKDISTMKKHGNHYG